MTRRVALALYAIVGAAAQIVPQDFLNHNRPLLDAHNCYPYEGQWANRIERALGLGFPIAIEQDIAWGADPATGKYRPVVTHSFKTTGAEPALREHFFERARPIIEQALKEDDRARWPLIVLHFDFKDLQRPLLEAVWSLLGEYEPWITTARKTGDPAKLMPFDPKPLLVLTEEADQQEAVFFDAVPVGGKLRVFGSARMGAIRSSSREELAHLLATLPPENLLPSPPTNYRRWWNNSWHMVEEGGQTRAGDWTTAKAERLRALVERAHGLGYWIRFYTLDGFSEEDNHGWDKNYNFGSRAAVEARWKAALEAGVNLIATDQYEDLADFIKRQKR
jgi:hypothetical protein